MNNENLSFDMPMDVNELFRAKMNDVCELTDGRQVTFIKLNRTRFLANMNGQAYSFPFKAFKRIVKAVTAEDKFAWEDKVKKGDTFYLVRKNYDEVFTCVKVEKSAIIGVRPSTGQNFKIARRNFAGGILN